MDGSDSVVVKNIGTRGVGEVGCEDERAIGVKALAVFPARRSGTTLERGVPFPAVAIFFAYRQRKTIKVRGHERNTATMKTQPGLVM